VDHGMNGAHHNCATQQYFSTFFIFCLWDFCGKLKSKSLLWIFLDMTFRSKQKKKKELPLKIQYQALYKFIKMVNSLETIS
jgi:hypothetical protein